MKVAALRRVLNVASAVQMNAGRTDVATSLAGLSEALKPADKEQVSRTVEKLLKALPQDAQ